MKRFCQKCGARIRIKGRTRFNHCENCLILAYNNGIKKNKEQKEKEITPMKTFLQDEEINEPTPDEPEGTEKETEEEEVPVVEE